MSYAYNTYPRKSGPRQVALACIAPADAFIPAVGAVSVLQATHSSLQTSVAILVVLSIQAVLDAYKMCILSVCYSTYFDEFLVTC